MLFWRVMTTAKSLVIEKMGLKPLILLSYNHYLSPQLRESRTGLLPKFSVSGYKLTSCTNVNRGVIGGGGRVYLTCLLPLKSLANPPLQVPYECCKISVQTEMLYHSRLTGWTACSTRPLTFCGTGF
jgi:hypothetical protein